MTKSLLITNSNYNTTLKIPVFNRYLVGIHFRALVFKPVLRLHSASRILQLLKSKFAWPPML